MLKVFNPFKWKKNKKIKKITLGICAMDKKAQSKPMNEILKRLPEDLFEIIYFGDTCILKEPIETWPTVEVLIAFYSTKFPTEKAIAYVQLRKPYMINDLVMHSVLNDRRLVYKTLQENGIDVPNHVILNRDEKEPFDEEKLEEFDEYIIVNGNQINKPLVEKPVDAEDHNIYIYYPSSAGGGSKRLFRKRDDRSSEFYPNFNELRRTGSYIYEEFLITQGTDVKVYTVGPEYGHAEARKSPVVDGRVKRDSAGLEVRYPVILSPIEKNIARKIVEAFKQTVCGFDILRVHGKPYCCDVNGFSFVKNSRKYYDDASQILTDIMLNAVRPDSTYNTIMNQPTSARTTTTTAATTPPGGYIRSAVIPKSLSRSGLDGHPISGTSTPVEGLIQPGNTTNSAMSSSESFQSDLLVPIDSNPQLNRLEEELRCVIAVIRHGDRTPKQKIKIKVTHQKYLDYFHSYAKTPRKDLKVKSKLGLVKFLEVTREIMKDPTAGVDLIRKLKQIRDVLERWEISGINRKLQMKPQKWADVAVEEEAISSIIDTDTKLIGESLQGEEKKNLGSSETVMALDLVSEALEPLKMASEIVYDIFHPIHKPVMQDSSDKKTDAASSTGHDNNVIPLKVITDVINNNSTSNSSCSTGLATELILILKWGGDLTPLGREQAQDLGAIFRQVMYPVSEGGGVLRLHATYRHDLKIKASDEGRVMKTAAAFTKGLLELEGNLTPIIASLVTIEEKNRQMLDRGGNFEVKEDMEKCKEQLNKIQIDQEMTDELVDKIAPGFPLAVRKALISLGNPWQTLKKLHFMIEMLCVQLRTLYMDYEAEEDPSELMQYQGLERSQTMVVVNSGSPAFGSSTNLEDVASNVGSLAEYDPSDGQSFAPYLSETFALMLDRWEKLNKDFFNSKKGLYDLSKVPDVYDMIRYDILHNSHLNLPGMNELWKLSAAFENSVVPQEYGTDGVNKRFIGSKMCGALLEKIKYDLSVVLSTNNDAVNNDMQYTLDHSHAEDLRINSLSRNVRTRLYFTSESHLHTLLNVLRYPDSSNQTAVCKEGLDALDAVNELSYLTQIVFRLYECKSDSDQEYRCEISFSPGATNDPATNNSTSLAPYIILNKNIDVQRLLKFIEEAIDLASTANDVITTAEPSTGGDQEDGDVTDVVDSSIISVSDAIMESKREHQFGKGSIITSVSEHGDRYKNFTHPYPHQNKDYNFMYGSSRNTRGTSITTINDNVFTSSDRWENPIAKTKECYRTSHLKYLKKNKKSILLARKQSSQDTDSIITHNLRSLNNSYGEVSNTPTSPSMKRLSLNNSNKVGIALMETEENSAKNMLQSTSNDSLNISKSNHNDTISVLVGQDQKSAN